MFHRSWKLMPFLLSVLVAFVGVFLLLTITPVYYGVHRIITEQTSNSYLDLTHNNHQHVTERLRKIEETALTVSTNRMLRAALENYGANTTYESILLGRELNEWLNNMVYIQPYITSIQVYGRAEVPKVWEQGRIYSHSNIPWKEHLDRFEEVDSIWLPSRTDMHSASGRRQVLTHIIEVFDRRGDPLGYVEVNLDEAELWSLIEGKANVRNVSSNRISILLDRTGALMSAAAFAEPLQPVREDIVSGRIPLEGGEAYVLQQIGGEEFLYLQTPSTSFDWRLIEIIPVEDVFRHIKNLRFLVILIGVCAFIAAFPVASFVSGRIIRPVNRILEGFRRIERMDFDERAPKHFIVEFHQLSQGYNQMARKIRSLLEQIEEEHRSTREAELRALQSQINPHFLYNTLDMINWMAAMKGHKDISAMASKLAKLFRISMSKEGPFITLEEELEHASVYAQIQRVRFRDRFVYDEEVDEACLPYLVPRIIIQPFIENSIIHGFSGEMDEPGRVVVKVKELDEERFRITIEDNGCGLGSGMRRRENGKNSLFLSATSGYGIENVNERIRLYFGAGYKAKLADRPPSGVRVDITLPKTTGRQQGKGVRN